MNPCSCPRHRLSKEERANRVDAAIDETTAEAQANGGVLPLETFLDDLTKEIVERVEEDLEMEI